MQNETQGTPGKVLDDAKLGLFQARAIAICFLIAALDGFDTQSIAFVAPAIRDSWNVPPEVFGPLFAAGLFGTMIGAALGGSLADRFGRKPMIIFCTLLFGGMSLACAAANSVGTLGLYRVVAGLGLGGAVPNVIALVSEYAPKRVRSTVIVATFAGFPLGAVAGGIASSKIIPASGWEAVFVVGGVLPLAVLPLVLAWVPESLRYLIGHGRKEAKAVEILQRIAQAPLANVRVEPATAEPQVRRPVRGLFIEGRTAWTALLWLLTFTALLVGYFLINWTPLLLVGAGIPQDKAILGVVALNLGGIIGSLILGRISDRRGPFKVVAGAFGLGAIAIAALGLMIGSAVPVLLALIFAVGLLVFGAQLNITALAANHYPLDMRSTGIGWSMGVGRIGSFVGPLVGGALIALGLTQAEMFLVAAIPAAAACAIVVGMAVKVPPPARQPERAAPGSAIPDPSH